MEANDELLYRGYSNGTGERERLLDYDEIEIETSGTGSSRKSENVDYEDAIDRTGYGCFHYFILLLCGWCITSDSIEILSISFVLPPAGCDLNLTNIQKGTVNSVIFIGMMIGGYCWGSLADIHGRRSVLIWSMFINALAALTSSISQSYYLFLFCRLVSGMGVGGAQPVLFAYFVEFQPKSRRGSMVSFLASFWVSGNILAAGLAWLVIPRTDWIYKTEGFTYDSWRIYIALCTLPSFTSAASFLFMPESPKYLLLMGRSSEALTVLKRVFRQNQGRDPSFYGVKSLALLRSSVARREGLVDEVNGNRCRGRWRACKTTIARFAKKTFRLFEKKLLRTTLVCIYIYSTLSFGYYGLFMWLPELFTRMDKYGGSACDISYANSSYPPPTTSPAPNGSCSVDHSSKIYYESFITAASTMPGSILAIFIMNRVGGRLLLAIGMVGAGISVFFLWFVHNEVQGLIISCVFSGISNIGWVALDVVAVESFPTEVRSTANGALMIAARISSILGNLAFGSLVTTNCAVPMFLVMIFLATGGLTALILPNKRLQDID